MAFVAGERTNARCSRCKDITSHVVIVVVDNVPVKVECCACKSIHKYSMPNVSTKKKDEGPLRVRANQSRERAVENAAKTSAPMTLSANSTNKTKKTKSEKVEDYRQLWQSKMSKSFGESRPYNMSIEVSKNDIIDHPVFGSGLVISIVANDKAEFLFAEGVKLLKCITK